MLTKKKLNNQKYRHCVILRTHANIKFLNRFKVLKMFLKNLKNTQLPDLEKRK